MDEFIDLEIEELISGFLHRAVEEFLYFGKTRPGKIVPALGKIFPPLLKNFLGSGEIPELASCSKLECWLLSLAYQCIILGEVMARGYWS